MNGALSNSSTFLADVLRGGDLPAGVGVGDAETIAAITSNSALTFGIIAFMCFTFLVVLSDAQMMRTANVNGAQ
jgi:preprotein translocase subunit SecD